METEEFLGFCPLAKQVAACITEALVWRLDISEDRATMEHKSFNHCSHIALNLVVVHACSDTPLIRNTMTTIETTYDTV